jgi:hypothetical protein
MAAKIPCNRTSHHGRVVSPPPAFAAVVIFASAGRFSLPSYVVCTRPLTFGNGYGKITPALSWPLSGEPLLPLPHGPGRDEEQARVSS